MKCAVFVSDFPDTSFSTLSRQSFQPAYSPDRRGNTNSGHLAYPSRCWGTCRHSSSVLLCPHLPLALVNTLTRGVDGHHGASTTCGGNGSCFAYEPSPEIPCFLSCLGATNLVFFPQTGVVISSCNSDPLLGFGNALILLENDLVGSVLPWSLSH